jgi:hypothetical protein
MSRRLWAGLAVSTAALVYLFRMDHVAGLVVDDAWYILLAKALASGEGYRLISSATVAIMPVVPPGFPVLLAPVFALGPGFPANVLLLKAVSVAAMAGIGAATFYYVLNVRREPEWLAAIVALATVLTPALVFLATSTVMPEAVFTLVQLMTVIVLDRTREAANGLRRSAVAGMLAGVSVLVRTAGVAMLAAGFVYLLYRRSWRSAAAFAGAALVCLAPWFLYSAANAPSPEQAASHGGSIAYPYSDLLAMRRPGDTAAGRATALELPARVSRNLVNVFGRDIGGVFVPGFYRGPLESGEETVGLGGQGASMGSAAGTMVVSFAISALLAIGFFVQFRSQPSTAAPLIVATLAMVLLVSTRTFRYLLPLTPFLWLYFATGLRAVAASVKTWSGRDLSRAMGVAMISLLGLQLLEHVQYSLVKAADPPVADWLVDARAVDTVLDWMDRNLPPGAPVVSSNPGLVYLRTGRKSVATADARAGQQAWREAGIRFMVALRPTPLPARTLGFTILYEDRRLWVAEIPAERASTLLQRVPAPLDNY